MTAAIDPTAGQSDRTPPDDVSAAEYWPPGTRHPLADLCQDCCNYRVCPTSIDYDGADFTGQYRCPCGSSWACGWAARSVGEPFAQLVEEART